MAKKVQHEGLEVARSWVHQWGVVPGPGSLSRGTAATHACDPILLLRKAGDIALFSPRSSALTVMESSLPPVYPQEESVGTCVWLWGPGLHLLQRKRASVSLTYLPSSSPQWCTSSLWWASWVSAWMCVQWPRLAPVDTKGPGELRDARRPFLSPLAPPTSRAPEDRKGRGGEGGHSVLMLGQEILPCLQEALRMLSSHWMGMGFKPRATQRHSTCLVRWVYWASRWTRSQTVQRSFYWGYNHVSHADIKGTLVKIVFLFSTWQVFLLSVISWTVALCLQGFSRQEYWGGLPCPPPGDLPDPGVEPGSPALQADSLPSEPAGKPL